MPEHPAIAKIVVNLSLDREFDYRIPERLLGRVRVGSRVTVPFGHSERAAYVVGVAETSLVPGLKEITRLEGEQEQIPQNLVNLARWIADYYCCAREQAVRALLPAVVRGGKMRRQQRHFVRLPPEVNLGQIVPELEKRAKKRAAILQALVRLGGACESRRLLREAQAGPGALDGLAEKGLVIIEQKAVDRDPFAGDVVLATQALVLTAEQKTALAAILERVEGRRGGVVLVHGVTGSGKTEVYLQAMARCLELGLDAIVLVPEIALTPQTVERFRGRFGETVSVMHSGLSDGERYDEWTKVSEGRARIVVGARSALFAPFRKLGLIVVDEEHENSYKQEEAPRYNARDIAVVRGRFENAVVVLGSATPSLETIHNCKVGKYMLTEMLSRADNRVMPVMELVDMRAEAAQQGGPQLFSRRLDTLIRDRLDKGEQTILFLNRRGYASQMLCTKCGYVADCSECSTSFTYHRKAEQLLCHLCGKVLPAPTKCPKCGDPKIRYAGIGTEKIESFCAKLFPSATVARMDSDTMTAKDSYRKTLSAFRSGRIHILIGTQMIAKGLHFPNVTLVGIVCADMGLHMPDFRAGERTFQLLVQVAGRAGRGEVPGHVVVQSYTPYHAVLQYALKYDCTAFFKEELESRQALQFPPVTHMAVLHFRGPQEMAVAEFAQSFAAKLRPLLDRSAEVVGPAPAPVAKVRGLYRYQLVCRSANIVQFTAKLRPLLIESRGTKDIDLFVDVDPYDLM